MTDDDLRLARWRLILGESSEKLGQGSDEELELDEALGFLYDREAQGQPSDGPRRGGSGESKLTVPSWLGRIHDLFPQRVVEILQADALERYGLAEVVTDPAALARVEPSETLLRAILQTKHLMDDEVLAAARTIVRKVVQQMIAKLRPQIRISLVGKRNPHRRSHFWVANNFDPKATIRANLKHWSAERGQIVIAEPLFVSRTKRHSEKWQVIIAVDQSGSMVGSVIHAAVTASIFHGVPALRTHLVAFDSNVVDLTSEVLDPVETLMQVQLGGGTDIARAVQYCAGLVDQPRKALVVVITDLYEGGSVADLVAAVRNLVQQGSTVLVLGALDDSGAADFDRALGRRLAAEGAHVGAMTPYDLANWVGKLIG